MQDVALVRGCDDDRNVIEMGGGVVRRAGRQNRRTWRGKKPLWWLVQLYARSRLQSKGEHPALRPNGRGDTVGPPCLGLVTKR
jgi:hypothetical protein